MKSAVSGRSGLTDHFYFDESYLNNGLRDIFLARNVEPGDVVHVKGDVVSVTENTYNVVVKLSDHDQYYISKRDGVTLDNILIVNDADGSTYGGGSEGVGAGGSETGSGEEETPTTPAKPIVRGTAGETDHFYFDDSYLNNGVRDIFYARNVEPGDVIHVKGDVVSVTENTYNIVVRLSDKDQYYISKRDGVTLDNILIVNDADGSTYGGGSEGTGGAEEGSGEEGETGGGETGNGETGSGETGPDDYIAIFGNGQSLMAGTNTSAATGPIAGGYMIDWDNLTHDANGPISQALGNSNGLVTYHNTGREIEGAGVIEGIQSVLPDLKVVFGTTAVGGQSLESLASGEYHANALKMIATMVAEIQAVGTLAPRAFVHWEQGQGNTSMAIQDYKDGLLALFEAYDAAFDAAAGYDIEVNLVITQVRSYSGGLPAQAQFELAQEHDDIWLVNTEPEFQFNTPASPYDFTHISAQGQYDKGFDTGQKIAQWHRDGTPGSTATVQSVAVDGLTMTVTYTGLNGDLRTGEFYTDPGADAPSLDGFGAAIFTENRFASGVPGIVSSRIIAPNVVEHTLSEEMTRTTGLYATSREHQDNSHGSWLADDNGMIPFQYFAFDLG